MGQHRQQDKPLRNVHQLDTEKLLSTQNAPRRIHEQGAETCCW